MRVAGLIRRPPRELADRARQGAQARLERWGLLDPARAGSEQALLRALGAPASGATSADLLAAFRARTASGPLRAFHDPEKTLAVIRARWPEASDRALARAERVAGGRFDLLGYRGLDFGQPIDWHLDPVSGVRAPDAHWSRVRFLDPRVAGDHKVVWELNRHRHLIDLGMAHRLTGDPRWANLFARHLESWMDANPPKRGINWASSLEVSLRSIAWLWALHFFAHSAALTPGLFSRAVAWLRLGGRHVERYLSTYFSPNTHLTGEALGLVYLGTLLPELPEARRWREEGARRFMAALERQVRADGVYFEHSTYYHRYTVDFCLHLLLLLERDDPEASAALRRHLEGLIDHLVAITRPDGRTPLIGDDDGGRLIFLDARDANDFRSPIVTGAALLGRGDWAFVGGRPSEELVWLLGPGGLDRWAAVDGAPPDFDARAFRDGGFYVMRSGWEAADDFAIVRCGPHGALTGGHAHADALAVELAIGGRPLLVDPGTATYVDRRLRDHMRSTRAHSAVTVGGASSCEPGGPFGWRRTATGRMEEWISLAAGQYFRGSHDGFVPLGARYERSVLYVGGAYWVIRDLVTPADETTGAVEARFQLATGLDARAAGPDLLEVRDAEGRPVAALVALGPEGWGAAEGGRVSPVYGSVVAAPAWRRVGAPRHGRVEIVTLVMRGPPRGVTALESEMGAGWRIQGTGDLLVGPAEAAARVRWEDAWLETDFTWLWARRDAASGRWLELFGVGGSRARWGDQTLWSTPRRVRYASARRSDDGAIVETEPGVEVETLESHLAPQAGRGSAVASERALGGGVGHAIENDDTEPGTDG